MLASVWSSVGVNIEKRTGSASQGQLVCVEIGNTLSPETND